MTDKKVYPKTPNDMIPIAQPDEELVLTDSLRQPIGVFSTFRIHPRKKVVPPPPPPPPVDPPPPPPPTDPAGWTRRFHDDFTTWDPSRYFVYPTTWLDTSHNGYRNSIDPAAISSDGTKLRCRIGTFDGRDKPSGCHFIPRVFGPGTPQDAGLMSQRVEIRMRADRMPTWKCADLYWPDAGSQLPGELDAPEGDFDGTSLPAVFEHGQREPQENWSYPVGTSLQDWHTYVTEWVSGTSFRAYIDGVLVAQDLDPTFVPKGPMHYVFQNESWLKRDAAGAYIKPDPSVSGYVELDHLTVWTK